MANSGSTDPFVSTEEEVQVDAETATAIEQGIKAADEGRSTTLDEARERMKQWLSKSSSPTQL
jgi:predicted transcriptional regulator